MKKVQSFDKFKREVRNLVKNHYKVVMFLASHIFNFSNFSIHFYTPLIKVIIYLWVSMARFDVIHMPCDCVLSTSYNTVCYTYVIRVYDKSNVLDVVSKFL